MHNIDSEISSSLSYKNGENGENFEKILFNQNVNVNSSSSDNNNMLNNINKSSSSSVTSVNLLKRKFFINNEILNNNNHERVTKLIKLSLPINDNVHNDHNGDNDNDDDGGDGDDANNKEHISENIIQEINNSTMGVDVIDKINQYQQLQSENLHCPQQNHSQQHLQQHLNNNNQQNHQNHHNHNNLNRNSLSLTSSTSPQSQSPSAPPPSQTMNNKYTDLVQQTCDDDYVDIIFDNNLLPPVQQNQLITETTNFVNFTNVNSVEELTIINGNNIMNHHHHHHHHQHQNNHHNNHQNNQHHNHNDHNSNNLHNHSLENHNQEEHNHHQQTISHHWNTSDVDLLDLDQRNLFFDTSTSTTTTTTSVNNGIMSILPITVTNAANNVDDNGPTNVTTTIDGRFIVDYPPHSDGINCTSDGGGGGGCDRRGQDQNYKIVNGKQVPSSYEDTEDKNLSWLFNYKLDELPHLSPEVNRGRNETIRNKVDEIMNETIKNTDSSIAPSLKSISQIVTGGGGNTIVATSSPITAMNPTATEIQECDMIVAENIIIENAQRMPKKPPFTYTELIEYALEDRGELTVSGIYQWISDRFPYYKSNDDRWKNSVRHNLSINPHFRKGSKAAQGAGHLWKIASRDSETNITAWEHKKNRFDSFFKLEKVFLSAQSPQPQIADSPNSLNDETAIAVSNIAMLDKRLSQSPELSTNIMDIVIDPQNNRSHLNNHEQQQNHQQHQHNQQQQQQQQHHHNHHHHHHHHRLHQHNSLTSSSTSPSTVTFEPHDDILLRRSAGEILNGVRRNVEVQTVNPSTTCIFQTIQSGDYLNPVPKDQIVRECGLRSGRHGGGGGGSSTGSCISGSISGGLGLGNINGHINEIGSDFYVTEIDPIELGVNMNTHGIPTADDEVLFGDDFNLHYFGIVSGSNNIMA